MHLGKEASELRTHSQLSEDDAAWQRHTFTYMYIQYMPMCMYMHTLDIYDMLQTDDRTQYHRASALGCCREGHLEEGTDLPQYSLLVARHIGMPPAMCKRAPFLSFGFTCD